MEDLVPNTVANASEPDHLDEALLRLGLEARMFIFVFFANCSYLLKFLLSIIISNFCRFDKQWRSTSLGFFVDDR